MNGYDIIKAMDGADVEYIAQSERFVRPKHMLSRSFKLALCAAIAAAVFAISFGAYAHSRLMHRESVEMYLENADIIEENGTVENQVMENEHLRITLDTVFSDGYTAMAVITLDALDEQGRNYIEYKPSIMLRRTDTGEAVFPNGGGSMYNWTEQIKNDTICYYHNIDLWNMDFSCDYEMIFYSMDWFTPEDWAEDNIRELDENHIPIGNSLGYNFISKVNFSKNVKTITLNSANGNDLILSQYEVIFEPEKNWHNMPESLCLIRNNGELEEIRTGMLSGLLSENGEAPSTIFFGKFIDIEQYKGIVIDGVEYLK